MCVVVFNFWNETWIWMLFLKRKKERKENGGHVSGNQVSLVPLGFPNLLFVSLIAIMSKQLLKETFGLYVTTCCQIEDKVVTPTRREPWNMNWCRGQGRMRLPDWLFSVYSAFLMQHRTVCSGVVTPIAGWVLPHRSLVKRMFHTLAYWLFWWRAFLSWGSLFSGNSSLFQMDKN